MRRSLRTAVLFVLASCGPTYVAPPPPQYVGVRHEGALPPDGLVVVEPAPPSGLDESRVVVTQGADVGPALERVPFQVWPAVPGHVTGLLYVSGPQGWGLTFEHMRNLALEPSRTEYKFSFDRSSAFAEYFVSHGEGSNFLSDWNPSGPHYDAAMFTSTTPNPWGLARKAHVVELEVNGGQGAAANNVHFVVTSARVLDGTPAVPMSPERVLLGLRARFDRTRGALAPTTDAILARAAAQAQQRGALGGGRGGERSLVGLWPTWVQSDSTLEVLFVAQFTAAPSLPAHPVQRPCPPCPCARAPNGQMVCAPCVACNPGPYAAHDTVTYGWDLAVLDRVDATGRLVSETVWGPREMPFAVSPSGGLPYP